MIRELRASDLPVLKALEGEYAWEFGRDFMGGMVVVDEQDVPVMSAGAWRRAEVHMLVNPAWGTPKQRMEALAELHEAMRAGLEGLAVGEVHTWMDGMRAFGRKLKRLGWDQVSKAMWARRI